MKNVHLAVNGTLMRGLELNMNLLSIGATFVKETKTEAVYRLWSIDDRYPAMMQVSSGGGAITVEIWTVPVNYLYKILLEEPPGLCIGKVRISNGEEVLGILGEAFLCEGRREITEFGGWRSYYEYLTVPSF